MFDMGFWELMLIAVMGLVVLGPERLPVAIRKVRGWMASARQLSDSVKSQLDEELRIHEFQASLKKVEQGNIESLSPEIADSIQSFKEVVDATTSPDKVQALNKPQDQSIINEKTNR